RDLGDCARDPDLTGERGPKEHERRTWVLREVARLLALVVREKDEARLVEALEEHEPGRRDAVARGGREHHRVRLREVLRNGVLVPNLKFAERRGVDAVLEERLFGGHRRENYLLSAATASAGVAATADPAIMPSTPAAPATTQPSAPARPATIDAV